MELRSVLAKKKRIDQDRIDRIEDRIARKATVTFPDASDRDAANQLQADTVLSPMDEEILVAARSADCSLMSFDSKLL